VSGDILRAEWLLLRRDRTFLAGCAFLVVLALYATFSGVNWQQARLVAQGQSIDKHASQWQREATQLAALERGEITLADAPAVGLPHVVRTEFYLPPSGISGLAIGEAELRPTYATISATTRAHEIFRFQEVDNPVLLGLGRFDLAFVVIYLLPLLIAGFGCSVLSVDRDSRTLQLVLSQPMTALRLATLRVGLRTTALITALLLGTIAGLVLTGLIGQLLSWAFVGFFAVTATYAGFWAALALWIVSLNRGTETSALLMVVTWAVVVLIMPALATVVAREASPMPSRLEYIVTAREAENAANLAGRELLQEYLLDHPELEATRGDAVSPFIKTFFLAQRQVENAVTPIVERFDAAERRQRLWRETLRWISPRDIASDALLLSTGNGAARFTTFERQAREVRGAWLKSVETALISGRRLTADEFATLPRPMYREAQPRETALRYTTSLTALLLFAVLIALDARRRLARYSVA